MAGIFLGPFSLNIASYRIGCYFWVLLCYPEICYSVVPFPAFPKSIDFYHFMTCINEKLELRYPNVYLNYFQGAAIFWVLLFNLAHSQMGRNNIGHKTRACKISTTVFSMSNGSNEGWFLLGLCPASATTPEHPSLPATSLLSKRASDRLCLSLFRAM